jgi:multisubunit Na+/H+ antiporter MnhG subunit
MRLAIFKVPMICFGASSVASACLAFLSLNDGLSRTQAFQIWLVSHFGSVVMLQGTYWSRGWVWLLVSLALILPSLWRRNEWTTVCCTFGFIIWFGQAWAAVIESV